MQAILKNMLLAALSTCLAGAQTKPNIELQAKAKATATGPPKIFMVDTDGRFVRVNIGPGLILVMIPTPELRATATGTQSAPVPASGIYTKDQSSIAWLLAPSPASKIVPESVSLYRNGVLLTPVIDYDMDLSTGNFTPAPKTGDWPPDDIVAIRYQRQ